VHSQECDTQYSRDYSNGSSWCSNKRIDPSIVKLHSLSNGLAAHAGTFLYMAVSSFCTLCVVCTRYVVAAVALKFDKYQRIAGIIAIAFELLRDHQDSVWLLEALQTAPKRSIH
jgi:hypothetical protein